MGILSNRSGNRQQRTTNQPGCQFKFGINNPNNRKQRSHRRSNRRIDEFLRLSRHGHSRKLYNINSWSSISIFPELSRARDDESDDHSTYPGNRKRNRYNKRLYPIALALLGIVNPTAALAESVGGVSATANPIANSSGSVTNQAIQVLQGPYITTVSYTHLRAHEPSLHLV